MASFDPKTYIQVMFDNFRADREKDAFLLFEVDSLNEIYNRAEVSGERLLDIGSGPVVHHVFLAGKKFKDIYLSDVLDENLAMLRKWQKGEIIQQESMFNYLVKLEGSGEDWKAANARLATRVRAALPYDLQRDDPLKGTEADGLQFDAISLVLCQNSAVSSTEQYRRAVENYSRLLKPGGHLIVVDTLEESFYYVGTNKLDRFPISKDVVLEIYQGSGFEVVTLKQLEFPYDPVVAAKYSDLKGIYVMLARKKE